MTLSASLAVELRLVAPAFALAFIATALLRRYGLRKLLDLPNERSSHTTPTPRGGGVAIVAAFLGGIVCLWALNRMPTPLLGVLLIGGSAVALTGFWDDHVNLSARVRFVLHLAAAALAVAVLGPLKQLQIGQLVVAIPPWLAWPLCVLALAWLLNLYNFMDGIDGIAAGEAVSVALCAAFIALAAAVDIPGLLLLAAACGGFLVLNWPPAKIFMGDAGSGFLGYVFGVYALYSAHLDARFVWVWLILLAVFWVDATLTLMRRMLRGERWYAAHRTHAYQQASIHLKSHLPVTLTVLAINLFGLAPLAAWAVVQPEHAYISFAVIVILLATAAHALGAGRASH